MLRTHVTPETTSHSPHKLFLGLDPTAMEESRSGTVSRGPMRYSWESKNSQRQILQSHPFLSGGFAFLAGHDPYFVVHIAVFLRFYIMNTITFLLAKTSPIIGCETEAEMRFPFRRAWKDVEKES